MSTVDFKKRSTAGAVTGGGSYSDFAAAQVVESALSDTPNHGSRLAGLAARMTVDTALAELKKARSLRVPRWKRLLDLGCILLSMPVWLPLMGLISIWIKIVSPGPALFRQVRVGLGGQRFTILKFRSMKANAETKSHHRHLQKLMASDVPMEKLDVLGDPRLIRGGKWLRSLGLDELPQLINVIRGEMSLVGPRPCMPAEFESYAEWQKGRVRAAPGLTGYWQVNGKNKTTFCQMISLDLYYAEHVSLSMDLAILMATIPAMFLQCVESRGHRAADKASKINGAAELPAANAVMRSSVEGAR